MQRSILGNCKEKSEGVWGGVTENSSLIANFLSKLLGPVFLSVDLFLSGSVFSKSARPIYPFLLI